MRIIYERVAGLDIHKKTVVACRMRVNAEQRLEWETETFGAMTSDLLKLHDWLSEWDCEQVAMESTADYWKPVFNLLEGDFEVFLVNAQHVKKVPGRKTDASDAEWLAELMLHGLLRASFIPAKPQRALRDLTRYRSVSVRERSRVVNRVQKLLEGANIKLGNVVTDVMGVSARAMLTEIAAGKTDAAELAELAKGRLRNKLPELEKALTGIVEKHHRFLLAQQLAHIDFLDEQIEALTEEIARHLREMDDTSKPDAGGTRKPDADKASDRQGEQDQSQAKRPPHWTEAIELLDTVPGIDRRTAEVLLAEIGVDMRQFPTADDLVAWAGFAPGNHESGGKRYSGRVRKGSRAVRDIISQAAWAATRTKGTFLKARYHRLAARRGKRRAIIAIGHSMLISIWYMLARHEPYHDLGNDYYDKRKKESKVAYLSKQLAKLGYSVRIEPISAA